MLNGILRHIYKICFFNFFEPFSSDFGFKVSKKFSYKQKNYIWVNFKKAKLCAELESVGKVAKKSQKSYRPKTFANGNINQKLYFSFKFFNYRVLSLGTES